MVFKHKKATTTSDPDKAQNGQNGKTYYQGNKTKSNQLKTEIKFSARFKHYFITASSSGPRLDERCIG